MFIQPLSAATSVLRPQAVGAAARLQGVKVNGTDPAGKSEPPEDTLEISPEAEVAAFGALSEAELDQVKELKDRDREVRAHEQAHVAAAGPHAIGGPEYEYQTGPDGNRYAVGGHVDIDTSPVPDDPEATIQKARVIRAAALAPAEPSSQDRAVAAAATKMEAEARAELVEQQLNVRTGSEEAGSLVDFYA